MPVIVDSYSESYKDSYQTMYAGSTISVGQSFTGNGSNLYSAKFYLKQNLGGATGNIYAKLYAHSGTFGTSSIGTGAPLATSDPIDIATVSTAWTLHEFIFSVPYALINTTKYVIQCAFAGGDSSHYLMIGFDATTKLHPGNLCSIASPATWSYSAYDACFYVYGIFPPAVLAGNISAGASLIGNMFGSVLIAGNILASATCVADIYRAVLIGGNILASATLTGDMRGVIPIAGNILAGASLTGDMLTKIYPGETQLRKYFAAYPKQRFKPAIITSTDIKEEIPPPIYSTETVQDRMNKYFAGFPNRGIKPTAILTIPIRETFTPPINSTSAVRDRIKKYHVFSKTPNE